MRHYSNQILAVIAALFFPVVTFAGPCDAHFTFDSDLKDSSGNGYDGTLIIKGGAASPTPPKMVEGKVGQAISLNGEVAVVAPVDLHPDTCPQVTITAWVKVQDTSIPGYHFIVSTGGSGGQNLMRANKRMLASAGGYDASQGDVLRNGQWVFVAGVFDNENKTVTVHARNRKSEPKLIKGGIKVDKPDIWIGAGHDSRFTAANPMVIDDLRVYGRILSPENLLQVKSGKQIPGDQFDPPTAIPGDQFVLPTAIPGDQFVLPTAIPGDQFDSPTAIPGDQFDPTAPTQLPGDMFEPDVPIEIGDAEPVIDDPVEQEGAMPKRFGD